MERFLDEELQFPVEVDVAELVEFPEQKPRPQLRVLKGCVFHVLDDVALAFVSRLYRCALEHDPLDLLDALQLPFNHRKRFTS